MKPAVALAVLVTGAVFSSCSCEPQPSGISGSTAASDFMAPLAGVTTYDYTLHAKSDLTVALRGADGGDKGRLVVTHDAGDTVATVTLADGTRAVQHLVYTLVPEGGYWLRVRVEGSGQAIEIDALADDAHMPKQILLATAGDPTAGATGAARPDGADNVFVLFDGASPADDKALSAWLAAAPIAALLANAALPPLVGATRDPNLLAGVAQQMASPQASGVLTEAIHGTADCMAINSVIAMPSVLCSSACQTCIAAVIAAAATVPVGSLLNALAAFPCAIWLGNFGLTLAQAARCWFAETHAPTESECRSSCPPSDKSMADTVKDECVCTCDDGLCKQEAVKRLHNGAVLCNAGCSADRCEIHIKKCGNGRVENSLGCDEACDPLAQPTGCKAGERCANDCTCHSLPDAAAPPDLASADAGAPPDLATDDAASAFDAATDDAAEGPLCHDALGIPYHCLPDYQCITCGREYCMPKDAFCCDGNVLCEPPGICVACGGNGPIVCKLPWGSPCGGDF